MNKKEKAAQRHQEDLALNKGLCWAGGAVVLELLLLLLKRYYLNYRTTGFEINLANTLNKLLNGLRVVGPVLFVLCVVWFVITLKKNRSTVLPAVMSVLSLVVSICAHVTVVFQSNGLQMMFLLVPVIAGLALAYYLYQKEFFLSALAGLMSVLGLWFVRYRSGASRESILVLAAIVLVLAFSLWLKKHDGRLGQMTFLPHDASYGPVTAACVAALAALLLGMIFGETAAYYLIFLMIAFVFALLVFFTVKLM